MPSWQVLVGHFDSDAIEAALDRGGPVLLVPNNLELAVELARQFEGQGQANLYFSRELIGAEDRELCWYRYSDSRFDGLSAPQEVQRLAPNLRLRDLTLRRVVRLDTLIHGWANHDPQLAARVAAGGGLIWLHCKQPAPIVAGASRVIEVVAEFRWTPLGSLVDDPEEGADRLAEWLEASLFRRVRPMPGAGRPGDASLIWRQDPLRLAAARQEQQAREIERLCQELARLGQDRDGLRAEAAAQATESAGLRERLEQRQHELERQAAELVALGQEREGLVAQRDALAAERDALGAEREALVAESEALAAERNALVAEREGLGARQSELEAQSAELAQRLEQRQQELERQAAELAALGQERESLVAQRDTLAGERKALAAERDALEAELLGLRQRQQELEQQVAEREALAAERDGLLAERDALLAERDGLRAERQEAIAAAPRRGDLWVCSDPDDPRCGSLLVLVSGPGEPERWEPAIAAP